MEHLVHFFTGGGEGERQILLLALSDHGRACWCAACAAARALATRLTGPVR